MSVAIYESRKSDKCVTFIEEYEVKKEYRDSEFLSFCYNKKGDIVAYDYTEPESKFIENVLIDEEIVSCYQFNDLDDVPFTSDEINDFFDDNGGEPDGNTLLIPVANCPRYLDREVYKCYEYENWDGDESKFDNLSEWFGLSSANYALEIIHKY